MRSPSVRRTAAPLLVAGLAFSLILPASAFFWNKKAGDPYVADLTKNGLIGSVISFQQEDFRIQGGGKTTLSGITIDALPDPGTGSLCIGDQLIQEGAFVDVTALDGLKFQTSKDPVTTTASLLFTPALSSGQEAPQAKVTIYLLSEENAPPVARNMELTTYKNVAVTGWFDAVDGEGDALTFQLTSTPARGAVTLSEDGSSQFVYTPYENKTGSDSFTYVAIDPADPTAGHQGDLCRSVRPPRPEVGHPSGGGGSLCGPVCGRTLFLRPRPACEPGPVPVHVHVCRRLRGTG